MHFQQPGFASSVLFVWLQHHVPVYFRCVVFFLCKSAPVGIHLGVDQKVLYMECPLRKTETIIFPTVTRKSYTWSKLGAERNIDQPPHTSLIALGLVLGTLPLLTLASDMG